MFGPPPERRVRTSTKPTCSAMAAGLGTASAMPICSQYGLALIMLTETLVPR